MGVIDRNVGRTVVVGGRAHGRSVAGREVVGVFISFVVEVNRNIDIVVVIVGVESIFDVGSRTFNIVVDIGFGFLIACNIICFMLKVAGKPVVDNAAVVVNVAVYVVVRVVAYVVVRVVVKVVVSIVVDVIVRKFVFFVFFIIYRTFEVV